MPNHEPIMRILKNKCQENGSLSVAEYMELVLSDPQEGYYIRKDPLGENGDFTTAPEISQIFGELLGAWVIDTWMKMGSPDQFVLLECGAGRGTLMTDMLRTMQQVQPAMQAVELFIMDISPLLIAKQKETLSQHGNVTWVKSIHELPSDLPIITIANEFLDALPVHQLVKKDGSWRERTVTIDDAGVRWSDTAEATVDLISNTEQYQCKVNDGDTLELSPAIEGFMSDLLDKIKTSRGAGLFIDYGHAKHAPGNTLQAIHQHSYCDPLENIGHADLTCHVNFEALARICVSRDEKISCALKEQGAFLSALGGEYRAQYLAAQAKTDKQQQDILAAYYRLRDEDKMGSLFKIFGFTNIDDVTLAGF